MPRDHLLSAVVATLLVTLAPAVAAAAERTDPEPPTVRSCELDVRITPETSRIKGTARLRAPEIALAAEPEGLPLVLHEALRIDAARLDDRGLVVRGDGRRRSLALPDATTPEGRTLVVEWSGTLHQDVAHGERDRSIHNLEMSAHIGPEGVYLEPESAWHPRIAFDRLPGQRSPDDPGCLWTLTVASPFHLLASGNPAGEREGASSWRTPFPLPALALAGGPLTVVARRTERVELQAWVRPESVDFADGLLAAAARYLELYEPLVGPYPFSRFTIVENFFSSGFAFPGFTLLSSAVVQMGERSLRPGYLDHELLHNWWGNGVLASTGGSHWSEAVATYCANYMRPILEGDEERARAWRRGVVDALSQSPRLAGQAVADYGRVPGTAQLVGYQKGAFVLDQLAAEVGRDTLWAGLRRFREDRLGRPSDWPDLRRAVEAVSGRDLAAFFSFWIDGPGLPAPSFDAATSDGDELRLHLGRSASFPLDMPVRLRFADDRVETRRIRLEPGRTAVHAAVSSAPVEVDVDPDFAVLRRLPPELLLPSLGGVEPSDPLTVVLARRDLPGYTPVLEALAERFAKRGDFERRRRFAPRLLERGHVVVLGGGEHLHPLLARLFSAAGIELEPDRFSLPPVRWVSPSDALLACVRNPERAGAFVCLYRGNAEEALASSRLLTFYGGNSVVVFQHGRPVERRDFERVERLAVTTVPRLEEGGS